VNKEIYTFNSELKKIAKLFNYVTISKFSSNRNSFIEHGLHLNVIGKGLVPKPIGFTLFTGHENP
jgi:hypothetical protein